MNTVSIVKIFEPEQGALSLLAEMEAAAEAVRQRAFEHFLGRGGIFGGDLDDWLRAERELIWSPAEMIDDDEQVILRVQAPGFERDDIKLTATPHSILIQADAARKSEESKGTVRFCEFAGKLFRRFDLPKPIDVDKVSATLDKGILKIVAAKAHPAPKGRSVPVAAGA